MEANYKGSQQDLYTTCRTAWGMCQDYLTEFAAFKSKYTQAFIAQNLADIQAADALPDDKARIAAALTARLRLVDIKDDVLKAFKRLKAYINDAFPESERMVMYNAAGQPNVAKATECSWQHVAALLSAATLFIEAYKTQLKGANNENMPDAFITAFKQLKQEFETQDALFIAAEANAARLTEEKMMANNAIYANVIAMLTDAKSMFAGDAQLLKAFSYNTILTKTRGNKTAGVGGKVTLEDRATPVENVLIKVDNGAKEAVTDKEGRYVFHPMAAGVYTLTFECENYEPVTVANYEVKVGVIGRLNIVLTALVDKSVGTDVK